MAALSLEMVDAVAGDREPGMLSPFVNRIFGRGKIWISEGAKRDGGQARHRFCHISDCRTAFGTETKVRAISAGSLMGPDAELARHFNAFVRPSGYA